MKTNNSDKNVSLQVGNMPNNNGKVMYADDVKLHKIYDFCNKFNNLTFENFIEGKSNILAKKSCIYFVESCVKHND